jgi:hypothetical protein
MKNKRDLNHSGNDPIEFAEFPSEEWGTEKQIAYVSPPNIPVCE